MPIPVDSPPSPPAVEEPPSKVQALITAMQVTLDELRAELGA